MGPEKARGVMAGHAAPAAAVAPPLCLPSRAAAPAGAAAGSSPAAATPLQLPTRPHTWCCTGTRELEDQDKAAFQSHAAGQQEVWSTPRAHIVR